MATIDPEEPRDHQEQAADATRETSGHSIDGDTPPAEGTSVGPTNHELDVDQRGTGAKNKTWLVVILALVLLFVIVAIIGLITNMF